MATLGDSFSRGNRSYQKRATFPGHAEEQEVLNYLGSDLLIGKRRKEALLI